MATRLWMISNRNIEKDGSKKIGLGKFKTQLRFYSCPLDAAADAFENWNEMSSSKFQTALVAAANEFPSFDDDRHEEQKHVTIFVHGYNNTWAEAVRRYRRLVADLYEAPSGLGECILFSWPSDGSAACYLPDRADARASAEDFADVLSGLYDWLLKKQIEVAEGGGGVACKAKTSVIAHSMGNYLTQCAMKYAWTRKNRPLLVSLVNQLLMVAADVDNDLFRSGETVTENDGEGIANLTYRVTALYSGRDSVLGMSAGLKHFGKRRLGRSGLDRSVQVPDNVWDTDCSRFFAADEKNVHSAYFSSAGTIDLMRQILRGVDRTVLVQNGVA